MSENENPFVDMDSIKACREAYDNLFSRLGPESLATLRAKQALVAAILDKADDTSEAYSLVKELAEELGSSAYSTRDEFDDVAYLYACAAYDNEDDVELAINAAQMAYSSYSQLVCMRVDDNLLDCLVDSCNLLLDLYEEQENAMAALVLLYDCCGILATTDNRYDSSIVDLLFSLGRESNGCGSGLEVAVIDSSHLIFRFRLKSGYIRECRLCRIGRHWLYTCP